jgi:hypothetical protein
MRSKSLAGYVTSGYPAIEGWCGGASTFILTELLLGAQPSSCQGLGACEIGVHHGLFFIGMHVACGSEARSLALDLFELQDLNVDKSGSGNRAELLSNIQKYVSRPSLCKAYPSVDSLSLTSSDIAQIRSEHGPFRVFSVDGGHTATHCSKDLETASLLVAPGGIVILDDNFSFKWPGVTEGLFRYLNGPGPSLVPFASTPKKLLLTQKDYAGEYTGNLTAALTQRGVAYASQMTSIAEQPTLALELKV